MERQLISKTDYRMMSINTKDINIPNSPQGYQRSRKEKNRIAEIVANFDERIANEPKLSYRDGHYNCFDGQHTIAARKAINKGKDLMIRCKVYYEQTLEDEAFLFANQTGIASKPSPAVTLNAYVMSRNKRAVAFKRAAQKGGVIIEKCTKFGDYRLGCINTALKIFDRIGSASFTDGLKIILEAWDGVSISLRADMLEGVLGFIDLYRDKYVRSLLVEQLKKHTPQEILNSGKLDLTLTGRKRFIHQIYEIYNEGIECKEKRLPILF